jgi:hypothetical protein
LDVSQFLYLVGTSHRDDEDDLLYTTTRVGTIDFEGSEVIVAYRKRLKLKFNSDGTSTKQYLRSEDDDVPYQILDIVKLTELYQNNEVNVKTISKQSHSATSVSLTDTADLSRTLQNSLKKQQFERLPRTAKQLFLMDNSHPDKQGFIDALQKELDSLNKMNTWIASPEGRISKHKIGYSKLVLTKKYRADGFFDKYKCRLVFCGDRWIDHYHNKTYAGTVMTDSIKLVLAIIAAKDLEFIVADVHTAFLHGELPADQDIGMYRPSGLDDSHMPPVVQLKKCLYGLPMAPAKFREHNDGVLRGMGFTALVSDPRVYYKQFPDGDEAIIMVHVDDMGIACSNLTIQSEVLEQLRATYSLELKDTEYLGMNIVRDRTERSIIIHQEAYITQIYDRFDLPVTDDYPITPMMESGSSSIKCALFLNADGITLYQAKVGALLYAGTHTRPDILFAINMASRQAKAPTQADMVAVDRIILYLMGTKHLGIKLCTDDGLILNATVDASYGNHKDRKSHTGITLHLGGNSGSFLSRSKKQSITADSSTVAELIGAHSASKEIAWARSMLNELNCTQESATILYEDNMSTIAIINNDCNTQKTKHLDIRYNCLREKVANKELEMKHRPTLDMTSDMLTKALGPKLFLHLRPKLLGMSAFCSFYNFLDPL